MTADIYVRDLALAATLFAALGLTSAAYAQSLNASANIKNPKFVLDPQLGWFTLPGTSLQGGHTSFPIFGEQDGKPRNLLLVSSEEGGNECGAGKLVIVPSPLWSVFRTQLGHRVRSEKGQYATSASIRSRRRRARAASSASR